MFTWYLVLATRWICPSSRKWLQPPKGTPLYKRWGKPSPGRAYLSLATMVKGVAPAAGSCCSLRNVAASRTKAKLPILSSASM